MSRASRIFIGLVPTVPAAPVLDGAISATGSFAFAESATATGAGPISATEALIFAQTAALVGIGALNAAESLTFSQLTTLVGTGALVGSEPVTFAELANLSGTGAVSATEALAFSELAALIGTGSLIVAEVITFGNVAVVSVVDTQIQDQFRFGADDGPEASHGWIAAQNVNITQPGTIAAILRFQVNNFGDFPAQQMKLQYKISTQPDSEYRDVPVAP